MSHSFDPPARARIFYTPSLSPLYDGRIVAESLPLARTHARTHARMLLQKRGAQLFYIYPSRVLA